ncbi:MAG: HAD family hydrolase [Nitrospiria bacterium]
MSPYRAILFDLCDTLVHFDAERLPLIEVDGRPTRSTAETIFRELPPGPLIPFDTFHACLLDVTAEIAAARDVDHREVTSRERFRRILERLGAEASPDAADRLVAAHMTRLAHALVSPSHHREVLESLGRRYRLGIVTNFDHAPTVHAVLRRDGLASSFEVVVISGETGWRKPHRAIFETALRQLGLGPREAFFVGDNFALDVEGASGMGMSAAWYAPGRREAPRGFPILDDLANLERLLGD